MKKSVLILILSLSFVNGFAHKDKHYVNNYGNVKTYLKTGYKYSEIYKIQIIGKLSEKISERLKYKDTILIEYIHDYINIYNNDFYCIENNSNYRLISGVKNCNNKIKRKKGIAIRIFADKINIIDILKLVEFSIKNENQLDKFISKQTLTNTDFNNKIEIKGNSISFIKSIINSKNSYLMSEIIKNKIRVETKEYNGIEIYWVNDKFVFEYKYPKLFNKTNKLLLQIKDFYYKKELRFSSALLVFIDTQNFYYLTNRKNENGKQNKFITGTYKPVSVNDKFVNKIIMFNDYSNFNVYLPKRNKMITKCE